jgi:hypothetical protein
MTKQNKPLTIEFAPGAFDSFDGTQEELDEVVAEIKRMFESGELMEKSKPVDMEELIEEEPEVAKALIQSLNDSDRKTH